MLSEPTGTSHAEFAPESLHEESSLNNLLSALDDHFRGWNMPCNDFGGTGSVWSLRDLGGVTDQS
jgi:hypothetical protein